jgi:membrane protease YdiL (CAAX protease family)
MSPVLPAALMSTAHVRIAVIVYAALAVLATIGCALTGGSAWHLESTVWGSRLVSLPLALALGALVGLGTVLATRTLARRSRWGRALATELAAAIVGLDRRWVLWLALASATGEELLFRGAIQSGLVEHGGLVQGIALTSLLFGAMHVPTHRRLLPWTIMAVVMGVVFGLLYLWTGEILAPLLAHAIVNYANLHFLLDRASAVSAHARHDDRRALPRA